MWPTNTCNSIGRTIFRRSISRSHRSNRSAHSNYPSSGTLLLATRSCFLIRLNRYHRRISIFRSFQRPVRLPLFFPTMPVTHFICLFMDFFLSIHTCSDDMFTDHRIRNRRRLRSRSFLCIGNNAQEMEKTNVRNIQGYLGSR